MQALLFVPILMGIALVVGGFVSHSNPMVGAGFALAGVALVVLVGLKIREASADLAERRRIWKTGRAAAARVIALTEVGGGGEGDPEVDLDLEVRGEGAPSSPVKVRSLVSRLAVPRLQPGCEIQVWMDAADGKRIVIDPKLTPYRME